MTRHSVGALLAGMLVFVLEGCASLGGDGLIHVTFENQSGAQESRVKNGLVLRFAGYQDGRGLADPRWLGEAALPVGGISGKTLRLNREPALIVSELMQKRFREAGFEFTEDAGARLVLSGVIREFRYDVGNRDEYALLIETTIEDSQTGKVLWTAAIQRKDGRFAGVSGNNAGDIAAVLRKELNTIAGKMLDGLGMNLQLLRVDDPVSAALPKLPSAMAQGSLKLDTIPARAKVYVDGVYFGMTPLQTQLDVGVHEVRLALDGYQPVTEKLSIRKGEITELESTLHR